MQKWTQTRLNPENDRVSSESIWKILLLCHQSAPRTEQSHFQKNYGLHLSRGAFFFFFLVGWLKCAGLWVRVLEEEEEWREVAS